MSSGKRGREEKNLDSKRTKTRRPTEEARLESTHGAWMSSEKRGTKIPKERGSVTVVHRGTEDTTKLGDHEANK